MKKYTAVLLTVIMALSLCGCGSTKSLFGKNTGKEKQSTSEVNSTDMKIGFLFPSDTEASDTASRLEGIYKMQEETGLSDQQIIIKESVKKAKCQEKIDELVEEGCGIIFSINSAFEDNVIKAAKKYPEVQFCQEGGKKAEKSGLSNMHNYDTRLYEAYHVAGLIAGMKLNHLLDKGDISASECVIGFVASKKTAKTASCINAFYLGVERVCSQSSILVRYVGQSGVYDADGKCARQLIAAGAKMMAQYTATTAVAAVCVENDIPLVGNDVNLISTAPKAALTSAVSDWSIYYSYAVKCIQKGKTISTDWTAGYAQGAVVVSKLNDEHIADGTVEKVAELEKNLREGKAKVFNTEKFTIEGSSLETLFQNSSKYKKYKSYIKDNNFQESMKQSAPVLDSLIDGITVSTQNYLSETETETTDTSTSQS